MTKKEKAIEIIKQGGDCEGFGCDSGGDNRCPCWDSCTDDGLDGPEKRVGICKAFLDDVIKEPDHYEAVEPVEPACEPAEKTLLDEFAVAAMAAIVSKAPYDITPLCEVEGKISGICGGAYDYAAAMMRERNRRDEMGNVKEATE